MLIFPFFLLSYEHDPNICYLVLANSSIKRMTVMCHQECHQRSADRLLQLCAVNGGVFVKVGGLRTDFNKISLKEKIISSVGLKVIKN